MQHTYHSISDSSENPFLDWPKADVHNHFHLGGTKKRFLEIYQHSKINFPKRYKGLSGMIDFIMNDLNNHLKSNTDVINFMENAIQSSIDDSITYLEASVDINLARFFENSIESLIQEVKKIVKKNKDNIDFRPEIGINKDLDLHLAYAYAEHCIDSGVFQSIDLYGQEANQDLTPFEGLYKKAKKAGLKTKVHIGEFSNAESIKNAIQDQYVMDLILERQIQLNICPESNLRLGAISSLKRHPIRKLFDKGIVVTINTDDVLLFHKTNSEQMNDLFRLGIFSKSELEAINRNAFPN